MKGKIVINGLIGDCGSEIGIFLTDIIAQVKAQPEATAFDCYINSDGGNVMEGFAMYKYLVELPQPVTMIGKGRVCSIATVVFMAGDVRFIDPSCEFMIHLPMGSVGGNAAEIERYNAELKTVESFVLKFYAEQLGMDKDTVYFLLEKETWLKSEDVVALGIATPLPLNAGSPMVARVKDCTNKKYFVNE